MRIVLHIGAEKTGTTAIQGFCAANAAALAKRGVLYPDGFGYRKHTALTAVASGAADLRLRAGADPHAADPDRFAADIATRLRATVAAARPEHLLLSSEHMSARLGSPGPIAALRALLLEISRDIHVVVYLRRQDSLLLSLYSTSVKAGRTGSLAQVADGAWWLDFDRLLSLWEAAFGRDRVAVGRYPPAGPLVPDFFALAGLPDPPEADLEPPRNVALDHTNARLLSALNARVPAMRDGALNPERVGIRQFFEDRSDGPPLAMTIEERRAFLDRFAASNARVRDRYFPGEATLFPAPESGNSPQADPGYDDAIDLAADIWRDRMRLAARIEELERSRPAVRARDTLRSVHGRLTGRGRRKS